MSEDKCEVVSDTNLLEGWGCHVCRTYNGLQRDECKRCGHPCCVKKNTPFEAYKGCNVCGVPPGLAHVNCPYEEKAAIQ